MQNERSRNRGASGKHRARDGEVLSAVELAAMERGQMFKRYVRAAAERALRAAPAGEASEAPPAPHETTGSGR